MMARIGHNKTLDWYLCGVFLYEIVTGQVPYYSRDRDTMLSNIIKAPLTFPTYLSPEVKNLLKLLLRRNPQRRLGKTGAPEIK
jgi:serine/threonine protein kinase